MEAGLRNKLNDAFISAGFSAGVPELAEQSRSSDLSISRDTTGMKGRRCRHGTWARRDPQSDLRIIIRSECFVHLSLAFRFHNSTVTVTVINLIVP
jgi:hypothetical protein